MKKIAYFDSSHDFPEQVVMAAGFTPFKILGDVTVPNDPADQYLQGFLCPAARSFLTEALAHSKEWEGIIVAHGCDATNRFYDIWKMHVDTSFLYWFNSPMNMNETAAKFFKIELGRMKEALEKHFKVKITDEKLKQAINDSNEIKKKLQALSAMRATKDVPNREYFDVCVKSVTMDRDALLSHLDATIDDWKGRAGFPGGMKKALLTGSDVTYVQFMDLLEKSGIRAIRDDLSIGERYFGTLLPEKDDPMESIARYHLGIPRPATKNPPDPRMDYLLTALKETPVDFVVSQLLKFCEPYSFDAVHTERQLKEAGYKVIRLEREFSPTVDTQNMNRLEAFVETL